MCSEDRAACVHEASSCLTYLPGLCDENLLLRIGNFNSLDISESVSVLKLVIYVTLTIPAKIQRIFGDAFCGYAARFALHLVLWLEFLSLSKIKDGEQLAFLCPSL